MPITRHLFAAAIFRRTQSASAGVPPPPPPPPSGPWIVGDHSYTIATPGSYPVQPTGPAGYTAGGVYDIDPSGSALPAGVVVGATETYDGNASAVTTTNLIYSYTEPGGLPTLTLHPTVTGTFPYIATIYLNEGICPSGYVLGSRSDTNLRSTVLSTWDSDGSAKVLVLAGETSVTNGVQKPIPLRVQSPQGTALTVSAISSVVQSIAFNFDVSGSATISNFGSPEFIWWANERVICARYRQAIGGAGLEAVIDIHAFSGNRAFVEVSIENGKMNPSSPVKPSSKIYTNATVVLTPVGGAGVTLATVNSGSGINGTHEAFRSWYCSGQIDGTAATAITASPYLFGMEVTHDTASMQNFSLLYRIDQPSPYNYLTQSFSAPNGWNQPYASDVYSAFTIGRHRTFMGAGSDSGNAIGAFPIWEARYLQSGDKYCRRAVLVSALAIHTYPVGYRDSTTGLICTLASVYGKSTQQTFPCTGNQFGSVGLAEMEVAHEPAVGLIGFLCRPSPKFIELAQGTAVLNALAYNAGTQLFGYYYQTRGKAWCLRNLAHATFLTPTTGAAGLATWASSAKSSIASNINFFLNWKNSSEDKLSVMYENTTSLGPTSGELNQGVIYSDHSGAAPNTGFQQSIWMHHWLATEAFRIYETKIPNATDLPTLATFVDWALAQPVRWVNEQPNGGWRYINYRTVIGTADTSNNTTIGQLNTWGQMRAWLSPFDPPAISGPWYTGGGNDPPSYTDPNWQIEDGTSGYIYVGPFWNALCAAVERGVAGADTAWNTVTTDTNTRVTNLSAWRTNSAADPRNSAYPRNK